MQASGIFPAIDPLIMYSNPTSHIDKFAGTLAKEPVIQKDEGFDMNDLFGCAEVEAGTIVEISNGKAVIQAKLLENVL